MVVLCPKRDEGCVGGSSMVFLASSLRMYVRRWGFHMGPQAFFSFAPVRKVEDM